MFTINYLYYACLVLLTLLVSFCSSAQGSTEALDAKNGFKDAKFGAPLSSFPGMVPVIDKNLPIGYKKFTRKGDPNKLGDIPLQNLEYTFYQDKLIEVQFMVEDRSNCDQVLKALQLSYGQGQSAMIGFRAWEGKLVRMNFMAGKKSETGVPTAIVTVNSKKMYEDIEANRDAKKSDKTKNMARDL